MKYLLTIIWWFCIGLAVVTGQESSPLHEAVQKGNIAQVKKLLKTEKDIDRRDTAQMTPLMWAVFNGDFSMVKLLVEAGADVEAKREYYFEGYGDPIQTPLNMVNDPQIEAYFEKIKPLESRTIKTLEDYLEESIKENNLPLLKILIDRGYQCTGINIHFSYGYFMLQCAMRFRKPQIVKYLIQEEASVNEYWEGGITPLLYSVSVIDTISESDVDVLQQLEVIQVLIDSGAKINSRDSLGKTPLLIITEQTTMKLDIVKCLIEKGAFININDNYNTTALINATINNHIEVVRYLLEKGAFINAQNFIGSTALMFAAHAGNMEMVVLFIENGANVNVKNKAGYTALKYAEIGGHTEIVNYLKAHGAK